MKNIKNFIYETIKEFINDGIDYEDVDNILSQYNFPTHLSENDFNNPQKMGHLIVQLLSNISKQHYQNGRAYDIRIALEAILQLASEAIGKEISNAVRVTTEQPNTDDEEFYENGVVSLNGQQIATWNALNDGWDFSIENIDQHAIQNAYASLLNQ